MSTMPSVAITGSAGFIGKNISKLLPKAWLVDKKNGFNILDEELPEADVYIHLAADPMVQYSIEHPFESYETNVMGTLRVLETCRKYGSKIVFASTAQVLNPINPYALQKAHCENLIYEYNKLYGVDYAILRLYNVFGPGEHGVIGAFQEAMIKGEPLAIHGGQQRRDFIHIDAVVSGLLQAIDDIGTYEIGSGTSLSVQEVADMVSPNQLHYDMKDWQPLNMQSESKTESMTVKEYLCEK